MTASDSNRPLKRFQRVPLFRWRLPYYFAIARIPATAKYMVIMLRRPRTANGWFYIL